MNINTVCFGEIKVDDQSVITIPSGLLGFEQLHKYVWIEPAETRPFSYLQSVEDGGVSFIVADPFLLYPDYEFKLADTAVEELGVEDAQDVAVFTIISLGAEFKDSTANLLAPVVLNTSNRLAKQIVLHNTAYKTKHKLTLGQLKQSS